MLIFIGCQQIYFYSFSGKSFSDFWSVEIQNFDHAGSKSMFMLSNTYSEEKHENSWKIVIARIPM